MTTRASVSTNGAQGNQKSHMARVSADGRFVVFASEASNLVASDTNGQPDVFARDGNTGVTFLVSANPSGVPGNAFSIRPAISSNGRFVSFQSLASDLVPGDTSFEDIFVRDLVLSSTVKVSFSSSGIGGNHHSYRSSISADGRFVAFQSRATNLVSNDTNGKDDVFVHDVATGQTSRVSITSSGGQVGLQSEWPSISGDGRYVAFESRSAGLVAGDTNGVSDVFVHDRQTGQTRRVSVSSFGVEANDRSERPWMSGDGRYVSFHSFANNLVLVPGDTNNTADIFVHELQSGQLQRVSISSSGLEGNGPSSNAFISMDGRWVAFQSRARNLVPGGDTNNAYDVFVRDLQNARTLRASDSTFGIQGDSDSPYPTISADGNVVAFESIASNLVHDDTNGVSDVFVRRPFANCSSNAVMYCTSKVNSAGCTPVIDSIGTPSASSGSGFVVYARQILRNKYGLFFYSKTGRAATPFQGGYLCGQTPLRRSQVFNSGGSTVCGGVLSMDFNALVAAGGDPGLVAGRTVWGQWWSRDPGFPAPANTNLTNAIEFTLCP